MKILKVLFLFTDFGFIIYWVITGMHLIPKEFLFKDYNNLILVSWNWSFMPLDIAVSVTGISSLLLYKNKRPGWQRLVLISLVLTFCSGLQAISYWTIAGDFDIVWWLPNLYLLLYPIPFIILLLKEKKI